MVLPLLAPVIILRAIFAFNQFYLFFVLSPPDNMYTMSTISYFVFSEWNFYSFSAAINVFTVLVLIAMLLIFNRASNAEEGVSYV
jgi:ABC-type sugar transport system permease subunit